MGCGCQAACGCNIVAGAGVSVQRIGDTFEVSSSAGAISVAAGDGIDVVQAGTTFTVSAEPPAPVAPTVEVVRGYWSVAIDGGAVGIVPLRGEDGNPLVLPEGDMIFQTIIDFVEAILPDELDPAAGGAEVKYLGGAQQLGFFQGAPASDGEILQGNANAIARSFTPGGTQLVLDIFSEMTGGAIEVVFLVIPAVP